MRYRGWSLEGLVLFPACSFFFLAISIELIHCHFAASGRNGAIEGVAVFLEVAVIWLRAHSLATGDVVVFRGMVLEVSSYGRFVSFSTCLEAILLCVTVVVDQVWWLVWDRAYGLCCDAPMWMTFYAFRPSQPAASTFAAVERVVVLLHLISVPFFWLIRCRSGLCYRSILDFSYSTSNPNVTSLFDLVFRDSVSYYPWLSISHHSGSWVSSQWLLFLKETLS